MREFCGDSFLMIWSGPPPPYLLLHREGEIAGTIHNRKLEILVLPEHRIS